MCLIKTIPEIVNDARRPAHDKKKIQKCNMSYHRPYTMMQELKNAIIFLFFEFVKIIEPRVGY